MRLPWVSWKGWTALLFYLVGFGMLSTGGWARSVWLVALAIVLLVAAAVLLQLALHDGGHPVPPRVPLMIAGFGGMAIVASAAAPVPGGVGLGGLCAAFLGIGHWLNDYRKRIGNPLVRGAQISIGCAVAFATGLGICFTMTVVGLVPAVLGILLAPIGLTLLSEGVVRRPSRWLPRLTFAGLGLVVAGVWSAGYLLNLHAGAALILAAAIGVLVLAIASSSQADVLLVVAVFGIFWASQPSGEAPDRFLDAADGRPALVALGDSYISGEGASEFLKGTNDAGGDQCRRAPNAYPRRVFLDQRAGPFERLAFLACSGAETKDLEAEQLPRLHDQIEDGLKPGLVVVSVGGNDAGFAGIATACMAPGSCAEHGPQWLAHLHDVADRVYTTYLAIRKEVGMDVPVVAVPYPVPLRERPCSYSPLGAEEDRFLQRFVVQLDRAIHGAADAAGVAYLARARDALTRAHLRICDADEDAVGVNVVRLKSVHGVVDQLLDPRIWLHNSFHPNETGHKQLAAALETWIADPRHLRAKAPPTGPPDFQPRTFQDLVGPEVGTYCGNGDDASPPYCDRGNGAWALTKVAAAVGALTPTLIFLVAGWWLLAMHLLRAVRDAGGLPRLLGRRRTDQHSVTESH